MTSNVASQYIYEMGDKPENEIKSKLKEALQQHFRPEFLNRLDDIIIFHRLDESQIHKIVELQLDLLKARLKEKNIEIEFSEAAISRLAELGFDPQYGARQLKRVIQKEIENQLAIKMLEGEISAGRKFMFGYNGSDFTF
jgi:ATP-dependent Clp protease ATP-binding subunit ClpB